jgi:O-methyltransferase
VPDGSQDQGHAIVSLGTCFVAVNGRLKSGVRFQQGVQDNTFMSGSSLEATFMERARPPVGITIPEYSQGNVGSTSFLLKLPWLRRYATEIDRLSRHLASTKEQLGRLKTANAQYREQAAELSRVLARQDRELTARQVERGRVTPTLSGDHAKELFRNAGQFDYYWYNAHKKIDLREIEGFGLIAARIRRENQTYLHLDRLYTLWQAVTALPPLASAVAEVGVYRGGSARFIAEAMRATGRELPLYVCDTFRGHVEVDEAIDGEHTVGKQFSATDAESVARYLESFPTVQMLVGDIRETTARMNDEHRFGFVHIDVDVYPITKFCLEFFGSRMVRGGTIVVDDYGFTSCQGAKRAVDEFLVSNPRFRMLHLLTGQAVVIPIAD